MGIEVPMRLGYAREHGDGRDAWLGHCEGLHPTLNPQFRVKNQSGKDMVYEILGHVYYDGNLACIDSGTLVLLPKYLFGHDLSFGLELAERHVAAGTREGSSRDEFVNEARSPLTIVNQISPKSTAVQIKRISRAGIMYTSDEGEPSSRLKSNMFSLSGAGFFSAVGRSINLGGQTALALRLLLAFFSSKVSLDANRPFGDEFRAARKASEEVGAQLVLGDRPIEITLERAWNSLKWNEKVTLIGAVVRGIISSPSDVSESNLKDQAIEDNSFQLYERLSLSFPSLLLPLINERDVYLAWSLKRSKAVNNCKKVVGVIGKGHMNGVIYALVSDLGDLRFRDLVGRRSFNAQSNGWMSSLAKTLFRDTVIGFLLWALYEQKPCHQYTNNPVNDLFATMSMEEIDSLHHQEPWKWELELCTCL
ncbi:hypothetical protein Sjap_020691 [Stephania japonica]|uniref:TraB domain-containing protein n=1 Tax=Stephania japonica TaxID=461633 RepID=A0AAP0HZ80_9MAGN